MILYLKKTEKEWKKDEVDTYSNVKQHLKRLSLQLWTFFEKFYFLFKSFVKAELS